MDKLSERLKSDANDLEGMAQISNKALGSWMRADLGWKDILKVCAKNAREAADTIAAIRAENERLRKVVAAVEDARMYWAKVDQALDAMKASDLFEKEPARIQLAKALEALDATAKREKIAVEALEEIVEFFEDRESLVRNYTMYGPRHLAPLERIAKEALAALDAEG